MDQDRPTLPRFADIGAQAGDRGVIDKDNAMSDRHRASTQVADNRGDPTPRPLHPPPSQIYSGVRPELLYQSALPHPHSHGASGASSSFRSQFAERHRPASPPTFSQALPVLPTYENERVAQSPSPPGESSGAPNTSAPYGSYPTPQQQSGSVAEGAVTKPKKLHREVEQKRRLRMAEQIIELRKWVSNPNGGKTDKVSVLQDAVTFVKDSAKKIENLTEALEQSRAECAQLRAHLNKSGPRHERHSSHSQLVSHPNLASSAAHLASPLHHSGMTGARESEMTHRSHYGRSPNEYQERQMHNPATLSSNGQPTLASGMPPSTFAIASASMFMAPPAPRRGSHEIGVLGTLAPFPSSAMGPSRPPHAHHVQGAPIGGSDRVHVGRGSMHGGYYGVSRERLVTSSGPVQAGGFSQTTAEVTETLPPMGSGGVHRYEAERKSEPR